MEKVSYECTYEYPKGISVHFKLLNSNLNGILPFDGSLCRIKIVKIIQDEVFGGVSEGEERELVIGESEGRLERTLEKVLVRLHSGEEAQCEVRAGKEVACLTVRLLTFTQTDKPLYRLSPSGKLAEAARLKLRAVELINQGREEDGVHLLRKALRAVCWADQGSEDKRDLYLTIVANWSLCSLKLGRHEAAVEQCSKVLERQPRHVKCLLRRAKSLNIIGETQQAKQDINLAIQLEPRNQLARSILNDIRLHIDQQKNDYTKLVRKMLQINS